MRSNSVVLPAPFGPMMPRISPSCSWIDTSSTAVIPAKRFVTPCVSSMTLRSIIGTLRSGSRRATGLRSPRPPTGATRTSRAWWWRPRPVRARPRPSPPPRRWPPAAPSRKIERSRSGRSSSSGGEPVEPDRALLHEERLVGGGERDVHRLLDEDHGDALLAELLHDVEELLDDERRQAERQLVDHEQLGLGEERHGQREHLLLATRELRRGVVEPAAQRGEEVERVLGRRLGVRVVAPVDPQRDLEVLGDAQRREHAPPAGHLDDALAGDQVRPHAADVDALVADACRVRARRGRRSRAAPWTCRRRWCRAARSSRPRAARGSRRRAPAPGRRRRRPTGG